MAIHIDIIKEPTPDKPYLVIYKPKGLPSAPLTTDDKDNALTQACAMYPQIKSVCGKKAIEYGLLHRLDTATDGLIVIAASQECYDFLQNEQKDRSSTEIQSKSYFFDEKTYILSQTVWSECQKCLILHTETHSLSFIV